MIYDSGAYHRVMDAALALGDWDGLVAPRRGRARGKMPRHRDRQLRRHRDRRPARAGGNHGPAGGFVDLAIGIVSQGQGHETTFAQL